MYITYYCDKFEFMVLCRFHIRNFTKKAENTLAARYWQFPYISAFDIFIYQILCTLTILKVPIFYFSQFCSDFSYLPPDQIRYILCRLTFPHAAAVQISWGSA